MSLQITQSELIDIRKARSAEQLAKQQLSVQQAELNMLSKKVDEEKAKLSKKKERAINECKAIEESYKTEGLLKRFDVSFWLFVISVGVNLVTSIMVLISSKLLKTDSIVDEPYRQTMLRASLSNLVTSFGVLMSMATSLVCFTFGGNKIVHYIMMIFVFISFVSSMVSYSYINNMSGQIPTENQKNIILVSNWISSMMSLFAIGGVAVKHFTRSKDSKQSSSSPGTPPGTVTPSSAVWANPSPPS